MQSKHNPRLTDTARTLRRSLTRQERHLWYDFLQKYPVGFYKQKVLGRYIADFYCAKAGLVIELDGSQHYSEKGMLKDRVRTEFLEGYGITVLRIPNYEVDTDFEGVCLFIDSVVKARVKEKTLPESAKGRSKGSPV